MRVLLVEDDPLQCRGLAQILLDAGHSVLTASSGVGAASQLQSATRYDAAIIDVCLPGASGVEVLDLLRSIPGYERLPVVIISGLPAQDLAPLAALHDVQVLQKPFELDELKAALAPPPDAGKGGG